MGLTYTICYCKNGRKCKSRVHEKRDEMFEAPHWEEITTNVRGYLSEEVCVPNAQKNVSVPSDLLKYLNGVVQAIADARSVDESNTAICLKALLSLSSAITNVSAYINQIASGADRRIGGDVSTASLYLDAIGPDTDPFVSTAKVLVKGLHRACFELAESKKASDDVYIFHHLGLAYDLFTELNRLSCDAIGHISTERLLAKEHPHVHLLERRWQAAGI